MFIEAKDDGSGGDNWTTGAISHAKLQSNHHHQQTNTQSFLQAGCPSCRPTNSVKALKGKYGLTYPKLTWGLPTLSLTTNSSWLPWGRVAMPLISSLMPVPPYSISIPYLLIYYTHSLALTRLDGLEEGHLICKKIALKQSPKILYRQDATQPIAPMHCRD